MKKKKPKKPKAEYYVLSVGIGGKPWERAVAGPWDNEKAAAGFRTFLEGSGTADSYRLLKTR